MRPSQAQPDRWRAPFFGLWTGQAISLVGSRVVQFALVWWLTRSTGSATVLATASVMALLPGILLGPLAGAYVDRWNRRAVMMVADAVIALASLVLAVLFWAGAVQVWHIYAIMFLRAIAESFHWPAMQASTSLMVPERHLARVAGLNQSLNGLLNIAAPPLGALLMELLPMYGVISVDVGTALIAIVPLLFISVPQPVSQDREATARPSVWQDLKAGLVYVAGWPGLMVLIVMAMIVKIALTPAFSLLPLLVSQHFAGGAPQLSLLEAVAGVGILLGGLLLGIWGGFRRRVYTILVGLGILAGGLAVLGLLPGAWFGMALVAIFVIGLSVPLIDGPLMAILQATVEPGLQGRVFMLIGSLISLTSPVGLVIAGPVSDRLGLQVWYVTASILCGLLAMAGFFLPALVNIEENGKETGAMAVAPLPAKPEA